jgi:hypothetical protein
VGGEGLAIAHFPQRGPDALLGQTGLPLPFALLALEALQRGQKPRRFWLAINHGDHSFQNHAPGALSGLLVLGGAARAGRWVHRSHRLAPALAPAVPEQLDSFRLSISSYAVEAALCQ